MSAHLNQVAPSALPEQTAALVLLHANNFYVNEQPEYVITRLVSKTFRNVAQGARVLAHYNRSASNLEQLKKQAGEAMTLVQANLTKEEDVETLFKGHSCQILIGKINGLCAGQTSAF